MSIHDTPAIEAACPLCNPSKRMDAMHEEAIQEAQERSGAHARELADLEAQGYQARAYERFQALQAQQGATWTPPPFGLMGSSCHLQSQNLMRTYAYGSLEQLTGLGPKPRQGRRLKGVE